MATDYQIKFYKGGYGSETALNMSTQTAGAIVFDNTSHQIFVGGVAYGGNITDVTFEGSMLTISKAVGTNVTLDFSDTASASATFKVFQHLNSLIGTATDDDNLTNEYGGTNYLTEATTLIGADKALDSAIAAIGSAIEHMDATNIQGVTVSTDNDVIELTLKGISEADGVISQGTGTDKVTFAKVANTGAAADVSVTTISTGSTATNVQDALEELAVQITAGDVSIDAQKGAFTTDNSMLDVDSDHKVIGVKTTGYIGTTANGIDLVADKVDTAGNSTDDADLATVKTVKTYIGTEIAALDVSEYAQAELDSNNESFSVYGIKEENGKINIGASAVTLNFGSVYDATNNRVALESNITDAINKLDVTSTVQAVTASDTNGIIVLTMTGVEEEDGKIKQGAGIGTVTFAKVAKTGAAGDVTLAAADTPYVGSNVDETIVNVNSRIKALEELPKFDTVVCANAAGTPSGVTWGTDTTVTGSLTASNDTMHKIYLVPATGTPAAPNSYAEYITVRNGSTYSWEKIGDTATDLTGYVKTITVNGKEYAVTTNTMNVALDDVITNVVANDSDIAQGFSGDYVDTKISVQTGTAANGAKISTVTSTSGVKVQTISSADSNNQGLAEASDVKTYIGSRMQDLDVDETLVTGTNVSFKYKETDGIVEIGTLVVDYATVTVSTTAEPSLSVTDGTKLAVGSDIEKVKEYTDYKISTVINSLDADVASTSTAIATVQVVEQDGKITAVNVTTQEAGVVYTPATTGESPTQANLTANSNTGAVIGTDIAAIKSYIDAKANEATAVVTNANATIPVGTDIAATTLGTVDGTAITAKVSFTWEEYQ